MGEGSEPKQTPNEPDIDPIAFDDEKIFGLDQAVHWIERTNKKGEVQHAQFPEIVFEITKHWNDRDWLDKLLNRLGYTADLYNPRQVIPGIFERQPVQERSILRAIRIFLLRAAGVSNEKIQQMFSGATATDSRWHFAKFSFDEVIRRRNELASSSKRPS